jgi:serine/threonine protein kinase
MPQRTTFGRYRLVEKLGEGGMAVVFRAVAEGPEGFTRTVALKRIRPELSLSPDFRRAFVDEARLSARLHHASIAKVFELGTQGAEYFVAMEYVAGFDLAALLRRSFALQQPPPIGALAFVICEVAGALAYAHDLGDDNGIALQIVHRDVSPANVMVTSEGSVVLLDFGIASAASHVRDEVTRSTAIRGKLAYFAPEQAEGRDVDRRADIFALGVVLHEGLTLQRLFRGKNDLETLRLVREKPIPAPSRLRAEVDAALDAVVLKMIARDVTVRYQSCEEVQAALAPIIHRQQGDRAAVRNWLASLGEIPTAREPVRQPFAADGALDVTAVELSARPAPRRRRWRGSILVVALVAVCLAGMVLGAPLVRQRRSPAVAAAVSPSPSSPSSASVASSAQTPVAPALPTNAMRRLHVDGPSGATVVLDGKPIGSLPLDVAVPVTAQHLVTVHFPNGGQLTRTVSGTTDVSLSLARPRVPRRKKELIEQDNIKLKNPW